MPDRSERSILSYESAGSSPPPHWRYGILAVVVLGADVVWFFGGVLAVSYSEQTKSFRIFCAAWLLGLFATIAAYSQKGRSRTLAHVGAVLVVVVFLLTTLLPTY